MKLLYSDYGWLRRFMRAIYCSLSLALFVVIPVTAVAAMPTAYMVRPANAQMNTVAIGGTVIPYRSVVVSAQRGGRITQLYAREGDILKFNQPVAALDDDVLRQRVQGLDAQIRAARSTLDYAIYAPDEAAAMPGGMMGSMFSSFFGMPGTNSGVSAWLNRVHRIDQDRANLANLMAQKRALEAQINYGAVTAPMDGIVTDRLVEAGEVVQAGQPLIKMAYVKQLRAEFDIPVDLASTIALGKTLHIKTGWGAVIPAPIGEIAPGVDARTHTQRIKLDLPPGTGLRLGSYVELLLPRAGDRGALSRGAVVIPADALLSGSALPMVRVIKGNGAIETRIVRIAERMSDGQVLISSGLRAGDIVQVQP